MIPSTSTCSTGASPWRDNDSLEADRENLRDSSSVMDRDMERETEGALLPLSFFKGDREPREEAEEARMSLDPATAWFNRLFFASLPAPPCSLSSPSPEPPCPLFCPLSFPPCSLSSPSTFPFLHHPPLLASSPFSLSSPLSIFPLLQPPRLSSPSTRLRSLSSSGFLSLCSRRIFCGEWVGVETENFRFRVFVDTLANPNHCEELEEKRQRGETVKPRIGSERGQVVKRPILGLTVLTCVNQK